MLGKKERQEAGDRLQQEFGPHLARLQELRATARVVPRSVGAEAGAEIGRLRAIQNEMGRERVWVGLERQIVDRLLAHLEQAAGLVDDPVTRQDVWALVRETLPGSSGQADGIEDRILALNEAAHRVDQALASRRVAREQVAAAERRADEAFNRRDALLRGEVWA